MLAELPPVIHVSYEGGYVNVSGSVSQRLRISAETMLQDLLNCVGERSIDLICIAAGTYAVDRINKRIKTTCNDAGLRTFPICFHVADPKYWNQPEVADRIAELLNFLTGDLWLLSFSHHDRVVAHNGQAVLNLNDGWQPSHLALYSGGLDSAAV